MDHLDLESIDWKILAELQRNARISNVNLADKVDKPAPQLSVQFL